MRPIKPVEFEVSSINDLRAWFHLSDEPVYVSTKIRKEWMVNHLTLIKDGFVYAITFDNCGGGGLVGEIGTVKEMNYFL